MFDTATAPEFAEGTIDFASDVWRCVEHDLTVRVGLDCPWCMQDRMTPAEFSKWLSEQARH